MTGPGDLNRRLTLQAPMETPDGAGGVSLSFFDVAPLWAQVEPVTAQRVVIADGDGATVTHRIQIRAGPEITTRHRLRDGARIFEIVALREADASRRYIDIHAHERAG